LICILLTELIIIEEPAKKLKSTGKREKKKSDLMDMIEEYELYLIDFSFATVKDTDLGDEDDLPSDERGTK
jgi:hypothetical protein